MLSFEERERLYPPVIRQMINAPGLSWTPSLEEALAPGAMYVWYVRALNPYGEVAWSLGSFFGVAEKTWRIGEENEEGLVEERVFQNRVLSRAPLHVETVSREETLQGSNAERQGMKRSGETYQDVPGKMEVATSVHTGDNTLFGEDAGLGLDSTGADYNTLIGYQAGYYSDGADRGTCVGYQAGWRNEADGSTFVGYQAGSLNILGARNTAVGREAGALNETGSHNTFIGYQTGFYSTGDGNTFVGDRAGYTNQTGDDNVFVGWEAGYKNQGGLGNVYIGKTAGHENVSGHSNVFIGALAGYSETGSNKLYIEAGSGSHPLIYGEFDTDLLEINGTLNILGAYTSSDRRLKKDIQPLHSSLQKLEGLRGVTYRWDRERYPDRGLEAGPQIGLIAQDVERVLPELVHTDREGFKAVSYQKLTAVLVEAARELKSENDAFRKRQEAQESEIRELKQMLKDMRAVLDGTPGFSPRISKKDRGEDYPGLVF